MHYDSPRWSGASSKMFITRAIEYTLSGKRNRTSCDVRSAGNHELDPQLGLSKAPKAGSRGVVDGHFQAVSNSYVKSVSTVSLHCIN